MAGNDNTNILPWPLVILLIEGYDPELAPYVVEAVREQSAEVFGAVLACVAYGAKMELEQRKN